MTSRFILLFTLAASPAWAAEIPVPVQAALDTALAVTGGRIEATSYAPSMVVNCALETADVSKTISGSGRVAVKLAGHLPSGGACGGWAWVGVRVTARVFVTTRAVREGEGLADAVESSEREITPAQHPADGVDGAVAVRNMPRGAIVEAAFVRGQGQRPGESVKVVATIGALKVEQTGRLVTCGKDRTCAVLPSGKHVEGELVQGRLLVTVQ